MNFVIIILIAVMFIAVYVELYDKGHIRKNIRKKQDKIKELEHRKLIKYNYQIDKGKFSPEQQKIDKLNQEIKDLEDRL